jgi:cytoskeletal protein CcmA (bactofilin family)
MQETKTIAAFFGKGTEFEGKLTFRETIRIDGHFKGEISAVGSLIVGEGAMIEADMHISSILISGEIHGTIIADERIEIHPGGRVFGDIHAPAVVIHEGAAFNGNCRMDRPKQAYEGKPAVVGLDEYGADAAPGLGIIRGLLTARENESAAEPIKGGKVSAKCKGFAEKNTTTDDAGYYELTDLEDGVWRLKVDSKGYKAVKAAVEISGGGVYEHNFEYS